MGVTVPVVSNKHLSSFPQQPLMLLNVTITILVSPVASPSPLGFGWSRDSSPPMPCNHQLAKKSLISAAFPLPALLKSGTGSSLGLSLLLSP